MQNIGASNADDPHYRYRMPKLVAKVRNPDIRYTAYEFRWLRFMIRRQCSICCAAIVMTLIHHVLLAADCTLLFKERSLILVLQFDFVAMVYWPPAPCAPS